MTVENADTLVQALQQTARGHNGITYINGRDDETVVGYAELLERALRMLGYLQQNGVSEGSELILFVDSNEQFVDAFWGALCGRIVAVPLAIGAGDVHFRKLVNVFRKLERPVLYTTENNLRRLRKYARINGIEEECEAIREASVLAVDCETLTAAGTPVRVQPEETAFIQFSSGSTGSPKGVVLTHRNVMTNVRAILKGTEIRDDDSSLSWMPLTHDMGIIGFLLAPLVTDAPLYLMPTELFVRRPMLWLQKISEKSATITASPNFGYSHLLKRFKAEPGEIDLSSVRLIFNGAEPISAELCREFAAAMGPFGYREQAMFPVYGLAEASLAATFTRPEDPLSSVYAQRTTLGYGQTVTIADPADEDRVELVRVGSAIDGCEVRVTDREGRSVDENTVGVIRIRGDNVTAGYYDDAALNREIIDDSGWLNTGDLGFFNGGELVIAGREKDLIIINGQNYHPQDFERICESISGLELGKVAAFGADGPDGVEMLILFVLFRGDAEEFVPLVREVRNRLGRIAGIDAERVIPVRNIPKTTSGKVQRYLLAEQYLQGDYDQVIGELDALLAPAVGATGSGDGSEQILLNICNTIIDGREVGREDNLFEIGASSLKLAQIHEQIEEAFPGRVEITDLFDYPTVAELAVVLDDKKD